MNNVELLEKLLNGEGESPRNVLRCSTIPACEPGNEKKFVHDLNRSFGKEYKANARIVIVGEAPGIQENKTGLPFVGQSGYIIDRELKKLDLSRDDIYITHAVKCRPTNDEGKTRAPSEDEIIDCAPLVKDEIGIVKPKVILAMGRTAIKSLVGIPSINRAINQGEMEALGAVIIPTYHPAALLHGSEADAANVRKNIELAFKRAKEISESKGEPKPKTLLDYLE